MAETTMEPWSFTIVFDEDKAKKNGYEVDTLYDYVGKIRYVLDTFATYFSCISKRISLVFHHLSEKQARINRAHGCF